MGPIALHASCYTLFNERIAALICRAAGGSNVRAEAGGSSVSSSSSAPKGGATTQDEAMRMSRRVQYAALPYRVRQDGAVQIRLITSRETRRWVIPKGWPMKGLSPSKAAAREAYEEAGVLGSMSRKPVGMYSYEKRLSVRSVLCDVMVFPLKVKRKLQNWPERSQRVGFWFTIESAAFAVNEEELKLLILDFGDLMARKWEEKKKPKAKAKEAPSTLPSDVSGQPATADAETGGRTKRRAVAPVSEDQKVKSEKKKLALGIGKKEASKPDRDAQGAADVSQKAQEAHDADGVSSAKTVKPKSSEKSPKAGSRSGK